MHAASLEAVQSTAGLDDRRHDGSVTAGVSKKGSHRQPALWQPSSDAAATSHGESAASSSASSSTLNTV